MCRDCAPGVTYYCVECDASAHRSCMAHGRAKLDARGGSSTPVAAEEQTLKVKQCTSCNTQLGPDNSSELRGWGKDYKMITLGAGIVTINVIPLRCHHCDHVSGQNASEFGCVPGSERHWFRDEVLEHCMAFKRGSRFRLSQQSILNSISLLNQNRGGDALSRTERDALIRALRY